MPFQATIAFQVTGRDASLPYLYLASLLVVEPRHSDDRWRGML